MNRKFKENIFQRERLLQDLGDAVKEVHLCISSPGGCKLWESLVAARLIYFLDCVLLFGLKKPKNGYWPFVASVLPNSTLTFINQLAAINTNLGKGRAWLLLSLNEGILEAFFATLEARPSLISRNYDRHALFSDGPTLQILITLVSGLEHVGFDFAIDVSYLNQAIVEAPLMRFIHEKNSSVQQVPPASDLHVESLAAPEEEKTEKSQEIEAQGSIMNSPLVKRRSHLKSVQDTLKHRVSFHEEINQCNSSRPQWLSPQARKPSEQQATANRLIPTQNLHRYKSEWALGGNATLERPKIPSRSYQQLRRYRSDLYLNQTSRDTAASKQDSPEMERGVPEGQEDPQRIQSVMNLSAISGQCVSPTEESLLFMTEKVRAKQRISMTWTKSPFSPLPPKMNLQPLFVPTLETRRQWLGRARQKWLQSLAVDLPAPRPADSGIDWNQCRQEWKLEIESLRSGASCTDPNLTAKNLAHTLGLDADDRYKCFPCYVDFYSGQPRPTYLLMGSKALHVTLGHSNSLLWSAALFDIEEIRVTWNYTVLMIRSTVSHLVLDFHDSDSLRHAVSSLDVTLSRQRNRRDQEKPLISLETPFQLHNLWSLWLRHQTSDPSDRILYFGPVYYEESFVSAVAGESVLGPYKEGHLMYRWSNHSSKTWHVGYFILKAGVLYQFHHQSDKVPAFMLPLGSDQCKGYGRNFHSSRPHTVEIQLNNAKCLFVAAASEEEGSEWLALLAQSDLMWQNPFGCRFDEAANQRPPVACGLIVTSQHLLLFQSPRCDCPSKERRCVATAQLESIPVIMTSPSSQPDAFCVIEFECREASEGTGDWILYFESHSRTDEFVRATGRNRQTLDGRATSLLRNKLFVLRDNLGN